MYASARSGRVTQRIPAGHSLLFVIVLVSVRPRLFNVDNRVPARLTRVGIKHPRRLLGAAEGKNTSNIFGLAIEHLYKIEVNAWIHTPRPQRGGERRANQQVLLPTRRAHLSPLPCPYETAAPAVDSSTLCKSSPRIQT